MEKKMKKIYTLMAIAFFVFALSGCDGDNGNNGGTDTSVALRFNNDSGVPLINVVWNGIQFGNLSAGDHVERSVASGGNGFIHFNIEGSNANFRTQQSVLSANISFTFGNTTLILDTTAQAGAQPIQLINVYNSLFSTLPAVTAIVTQLGALLDDTRVVIYMVDGIDKLQNLPINSILRTTPIAITVEHTNEISTIERDSAIGLVRNLFIEAGFSNVTINVNIVILHSLPAHAAVIGALTSLGGSGFVTDVDITNYTVNGINVTAGNEGSFPAISEIKITVFFRSQMFGQTAIENEIKQIFNIANFNNITVTAVPR